MARGELRIILVPGEAFEPAVEGFGGKPFGRKMQVLDGRAFADVFALMRADEAREGRVRRGESGGGLGRSFRILGSRRLFLRAALRSFPLLALQRLERLLPGALRGAQAQDQRPELGIVPELVLGERRQKRLKALCAAPLEGGAGLKKNLVQGARRRLGDLDAGLGVLRALREG